jgi:hypothetical protein
MDEENEVPELANQVVQNNSRQVVCSSCGNVGHIRSNRNCPNYVGRPRAVRQVRARNENNNIVAPEVIPVYREVDEGVAIGLEAIDIIGGVEPQVDDIPEDPVELDRSDDEIDINLGDYEHLEWHEIDVQELPEGVEYMDYERPQFNGDHVDGVHNAGNLIGIQLEDESDFMNLFIDDVVVNNFVENTNKFGRRYVKGWVKRGRTVGDTCVEEMRALFATWHLVGLNKSISRDELFRKGPREFPFIHRLFTRKRFDNLMVAIHYVSIEEYRLLDEEGKKAYRKAHPFYLVEPYVELLKVRFRKYWRVGQRCGIDEQGIPWKGRHICRCFNNAKPHPFHFKVLSLNDSSNGYCSNFYLYEGKAEFRPPGVKATVWPFIKLLTDPGGEDPDQYLNKNHMVSADNWFNGFVACSTVQESGNECNGTVRSNRLGPAKNLILKEKEGDRGDLKVFGANIENGKSLYITSWIDSKVVTMLSTMPTAFTICRRMVETKVNGEMVWEEREIFIPTIIKVYNKNMGATDVDDQKISYYYPRVKTVSWAPRIFTHFNQSALVNAYCIMVSVKNLNKKKYRLKHFISNYIDQQVRPWLEKISGGNVTVVNHHRGRAWTEWNKDKLRLVGRHFPIVNEEPVQEGSGHGNSIKRNLKRGKCMLCNTKCSTKCEHCGVYLCIRSTSVMQQVHDKNCFHKFHTLEDFTEGDDQLYL